METKNQNNTINLLSNIPLSFLLFVYFLVCRVYLLFRYFLRYRPKFQSYHFHFISSNKRGSPSAIVAFQVASHFHLTKLKHITLDLSTLNSSFFAITMKSFSLLVLQFPISKYWVLLLCWFGHLNTQQCPTMPNRDPAMLGFVGRDVVLVWSSL